MAATKRIRRRVGVVFGVLVLCLLSVAGRLFQLQILDSHTYIKLAQKQSQGNLLTLPVRGKIMDRNLKPLAESIDTKSVVMNASKFDPDTYSLQHISDELDISLHSVRSKTQDTRLTYLKRKLLPEELTRTQHVIEEQDLHQAGIFLIPDTKRFYPQHRLASNLLGFTGLDEKGYDNHGLEGLEYYYDHYLRGQAEWLSVPMDAKRNSLDSWALEVKNAGHNLVLTIDKNIQYMVERELEVTFRDEGAKHAVVIVMNPHNGEILAMANYPNFNPNDFARYPQEAYKNRAVGWAYEPGSTFKIIQTAASFEEGILSPWDRYDNQGGFLKGNTRTQEEGAESGLLSVEDILVKSNNLGAMKIAEQLGQESFYEYITRFGFGEITGIDLPGEVGGRLRTISDWSSLSLHSLAIGQEISVTPLQMAAAFSVIANGGVLYRPYIVKEIQYMDGAPALQIEASKVRRVISRKTAQFMREILTKVVERGTGKLANPQGYRVGGKTGTAQKYNPVLNDYSSTSLVTSFIGFAPAEYPQVVIATIIDEPAHNEWGGTVAAPLFRRITERVLPYLDIPSEDGIVHEFVALKMP